MIKLVGGLVGAIILAIAWALRQQATKTRIAEFDNGTRCIVCHSRNMTVADGKARCGDCLHVSDLAVLRSGVVTDEQIRDATRPQ